MSTNTPHTTTDGESTDTDDNAYPTTTPTTTRTIPEDAPLGEDFDYDAPWHEFMRTTDDAHHDPVAIATTLQDRIGDLPEGKATFRLTDILDREDDPAPSAVQSHKLVELTGAWPAPDALGGGKRNTRWVNPNYRDARYYAETATRCDCGAAMVRLRDAPNSDPATQGEHQHADGCPVDARLHARARIHANRREVLTRVLHLGLSARANAERLGVNPNRRWANATGKKLGVDISAAKESGYQRCARTWARLLVDHTPSEVAAAYGRSAGEWVRENVRKRTAASPGDLYDYRRDDDAGWGANA